MQALSVPFAALVLASSGAFAAEATQFEVPPPSAAAPMTDAAREVLAEVVSRGEATVFVDRMGSVALSREAVRAEAIAAQRRRGGPGLGYGEASAAPDPAVM